MSEVTDEDREAGQAWLKEDFDRVVLPSDTCFAAGHAVQRERADALEAGQGALSETIELQTSALKKARAESERLRERVVTLEIRLKRLDVPNHMKWNEGYDDGDG